MKKKMISLALALVLMLSLAIPAFAATYSSTGSYTGTTGTCTYHAYATCNNSSWDALTEWTGSTDSYANYTFKTEVALWTNDGSGGYTTGGYYRGPASTHIGRCSGSGYSVYAIDAFFFVNNTQVKSIQMLNSV